MVLCPFALLHLPLGWEEWGVWDWDPPLSLNHSELGVSKLHPRTGFQLPLAHRREGRAVPLSLLLVKTSPVICALISLMQKGKKSTSHTKTRKFIQDYKRLQGFFDTATANSEITDFLRASEAEHFTKGKRTSWDVSSCSRREKLVPCPPLSLSFIFTQPDFEKNIWVFVTTGGQEHVTLLSISS